MAFLHPAVLQGARFVVRQATETAIVSLAPTSDPATVASTIASSTAPTSVVSSTAAPSPTESSTLANGGGNSGGNGGNSGGGGGGGGGGGNSSSLLFFVALGFGVVFTNLWIIVGVKYCFRYNARNRQMRSEDGEPINMENMPRPHRRRREKKLMPIDEVNEKFPMLKYKTWVASRAQEGLPTRGGVSAPPSRPSSLRDVEGVASELPPKERLSTDERPTTSTTAPAPPASAGAAAMTPTTTTAGEPVADSVQDKSDKDEAQNPQHASKEIPSSPVGTALRRTSTDSHHEPETSVAHKHMSQFSHDDDDDDEHIDPALPPECVGTSGDTCAICIDTLEDDDDVRGLTCGHAFHAVCIDPWLTTRRACCPLCKTDYYTPKPRPQASEGGDNVAGVVHVTVAGDSEANPRVNMPSRPRPPFFSMRRTWQRPANLYAPSRRRTNDEGIQAMFPRRRSRSSAEPQPSAARFPVAGSFFSGLRSAIPRFRQSNQTQSDAVASGANPASTTPSQLEAGVRNPQS